MRKFQVTVVARVRTALTIPAEGRVEAMKKATSILARTPGLLIKKECVSGSMKIQSAVWVKEKGKPKASKPAKKASKPVAKKPSAPVASPSATASPTPAST